MVIALPVPVVFFRRKNQIKPATGKAISSNTAPARMSQVEKNTLRMYLANNNGGLYWPKQNGTIYRGMMFFSISPEIGRYLAENVKEQTLLRHNYGKSRFPLWWMIDAPYFQRDYTGDEGVGLVQPEMMGTLFPIEKWVVGADAPIAAGSCAFLRPAIAGTCPSQRAGYPSAF